MNHPGTTPDRVRQAGGGFAPALDACRGGLPPAVRRARGLTDRELPEPASRSPRPAHTPPAAPPGARPVLRTKRATISRFTRGGGSVTFPCNP